MIQSIIILTFFVSAWAATTETTTKINNENSRPSARMKNFCVLPSKWTSIIAYLHPNRALNVSAEETSAYSSSAWPSTNASIAVDFASLSAAYHDEPMHV